MTASEIGDMQANALRRLGFLEQLHAAAQVHATLALAEQTRLANLQRMGEMIGKPVDFTETPPEVVERQMPVLIEIQRQLRDGLGIDIP